MLAKTCCSLVNGCCPSHIAPSPPMCDTVAVCAGFCSIAMVWQPMPASARDPSGTLVERLCGQPEQKLGARTGTLTACGLASVTGCFKPQPGATDSMQATRACAICGG